MRLVTDCLTCGTDLRLHGCACYDDPRLALVNRVGGEIMAWIAAAYPDVPQAERIARDAIALFIGGMQEPELVVGRGG